MKLIAVLSALLAVAAAAPGVFEARSCKANGASCTSGDDCCSQYCVAPGFYCGSGNSCFAIGAACLSDNSCCSGNCGNESQVCEV